VSTPAVVLLGPPGSGKGTQAERLRDHGFATLATGDLLREARAAGTELGERASEYMDRGDLVPDDLIVAVIGEQLSRLDGEPVLLDGFPRTVGQADALAEALAARDRALDHVVLIDVPDDVVARMDGAPAEMQAEEGYRLALEIVEQVRAIPGIAGIHLMSIRNEAAIVRLVEDAGLMPRPTVRSAS
jgi:adenylate kinase